MEHDPEEIIRLKLRGEEMIPAQWNRDAAWNDVRGSLESRPVKRFYAMAACISIVLFFATGDPDPTMETSGTENQEICTEPLKENYVAAIPQVHAPLLNRKKNTMTQRPRMAEKTSVESEGREMIPETTTISLPVEVSAMPSDSLQVVSVPVVITEKVQPVIGVVPENKVVATGPKQKKIRFLKFQKDETPLELSNDPKLIIARIR